MNTPINEDTEFSVSAYERAPCGLVTITKEGEVVTANRTYRVWLGVDHVENLPNFIEGLRAGDRIFWGTHLGPLLDLQGFVSEIAIELTTSDGPMPALLSAVSTAPGDPTGTIDIAIFSAHDRRTYERELLAERKLAEAAEAKARRLAETLQVSLIPPSLPTIPGIDLAASYRPAGDGAEVGGDWYEVFQIDETSWVVSIGDVVGKGATAAASTAFVRYTIRGAAMATRDPKTVLRDVNKAMLMEQGDPVATVALILMELAGPQPRLTVCSAGHPLPRLVRANGSVSKVGQAGTLLGAFATVEHKTTQLDLGHGETVVLYTDGLTEGRRGEVFYGERRLKAALEKMADLDTEEIATTIEAGAVEFQDGFTSDDIAIVVLRCT